MGAYVSALPTASYALLPPPSTKPAPVPTNDQPTTDPQPNASTIAATTKRPSPLRPETPDVSAQLGRYIALDCEMVGSTSLTPFSIRSRNDSADFSVLARASLVSYSHAQVYDAYVLPPPGVVVTDYRTRWSGILPAHLDRSRAHDPDPAVRAQAPRPFAQVQREVAELLEGRVLVGHALQNDLAVLGLSHPKGMIRDTARHAPFRARLAPVDARTGEIVGRARAPALKKLAKEVLGWNIQEDVVAGHSSVEDARAAMALYQHDKAAFEREALGRGTRGGGARMASSGRRGKRP